MQKDAQRKCLRMLVCLLKKSLGIDIDNGWKQVTIRMVSLNDNRTSPNTTEYLIYYWLSSHELKILQKISIILYSIIFILGIIGNGLVIWIARFRMKKTISVMWFLHLAIADLLCCASIPMRIAEWSFSGICSVSSGIYCLMNNILFYLNLSVSVLLLTAMSVDRWVSVMWPFWAKDHRTLKLVRITAGIIWGLSFIWTGILFFYFHFLHNVKKSYVQDLIVDLISLVLMFVIPFLIIFTSYVTIYLKPRKSSRLQRSQRPYRIITAVILCFFICWAPYYIWALTSQFQYDTTDIVIKCLAYLNSCINPIIYVIMGQDFRHSFLRSIPFRVEKALSEPPDDLGREQEDPDRTPATDV
ncbi:C3a anaphylatoxin chemotactic receptor-like [Engystomops pustulosus]|uniref:C3a anaphylatoxin chemotactic receptor-like n=1 Tax=Engystomops pustulosus TaxID=76066 RepID=UPI003AFA264A